MSDDYDYQSVRRPVKTMLLADRAAVIEECARELDEMVAAAKAVGTHKEQILGQILGLASAAAAIRALKDKA